VPNNVACPNRKIPTKITDKLGQVPLGQHWSNPAIDLKYVLLCCHTYEEKICPISCTNQSNEEREEEVELMRCQMRLEVSLIYRSHWGVK